MIYKWTYEESSPSETAAVEELAKETGVHPALAKLLMERGFTTAGAVRRFFKPQLTELHDPFLMNDMAEAAQARIRRASAMAVRLARSLTPLLHLVCTSLITAFAMVMTE